MKEKFALLIGVAILAVVGLSMLGGAWYSYNETQHFLQSSISTTGTVINLKTEIRKNRTGRRTTSYYPVIEFNSPNQQKIIFTSAVAVDQYQYPLYEQVKILYRSSNPSDARLNSFDSLWGTTIALSVIGVSFMIAAALVYLIFVRQKKFNEFNFVNIGFGLTVILLYFGAWWFSQDSLYLRKHGMSTVGTVVKLNPAPVVEFQTQEGKILKYQSHVSSNPPKYAPGDKVPVLYDPKDPNRVSIDAFDELWFVTSLMGGMGTLFLLILLVLIYMDMRNKKKLVNSNRTEFSNFDF